MITYKVTMEITIADTDAPPSDWMPYSLKQLMEDDETIENFTCEEIEQ